MARVGSEPKRCRSQPRRSNHSTTLPTVKKMMMMMIISVAKKKFPHFQLMDKKCVLATFPPERQIKIKQKRPSFPIDA